VSAGHAMHRYRPGASAQSQELDASRHSSVHEAPAIRGDGQRRSAPLYRVEGSVLSRLDRVPYQADLAHLLGPARKERSSDGDDEQRAGHHRRGLPRRPA